MAPKAICTTHAEWGFGWQGTQHDTMLRLLCKALLVSAGLLSGPVLTVHLHYKGSAPREILPVVAISALW